MGEGRKYYNVEEFYAWKRQQGNNYRLPSPANFLAAANWIRNLLDGKKITWAAFGGLAMLCLGSRRDMINLHIVYDDGDFNRIKSKLETDQRVRLPKGMNSLFPSKILVGTGPKFKDAGCTENVDVELDLVPPGSHGTPPNDLLRKNMVLLRLGAGAKANSYKGLNMLYLVKTTIYYCKIQENAWDPKKDVLFLCQNYGKDIESIRVQLNQKEVQENFLGTSFFSRLSPDDKRQCYLVLLGKEPPPKMTITPSVPHNVHKQSVSTSDLPRPRIPSHKSSPSLNIARQQADGYLSPPLPGKPKPLRPSAPLVDANTAQAPPVPRSHIVPIYSSAPKDSRSRYRPVSAPTMPNATQNTNAEKLPTNVSRSKDSRPKDTQSPPQQSTTPSFKPQPVGIQDVTNVTKTNMIPDNIPPPNIAQPRKSMPNLNGYTGNADKVSAYNHIQSPVPPMPKGFPIPSQGNSLDMPPSGIASTQRSQPRGSPPRQVQLPPNRVRVNSGPFDDAPITARPVPPQARASYQPHQPVKVKGREPFFEPPVLNAIDLLSSQVGGLRLVGPEGVYPAPHKPISPPQATQAIPPMSYQNLRTTSETQSNFVFELDASPPQLTQGPVPQPNGFIAELPAEMDASRPVFSIAAPTSTGPHDVSPLTPPADSHAISAPLHPPQPMSLARPTELYTQPTPFEALPASLMIGGPSHRHAPINSTDQPHFHSATIPSNASKYQRYYSPPSSTPNSTNPSPKQVPVTTYKAYSGPVSPPMPSSSAPAKLQKAPTAAHIQATMPDFMRPEHEPQPRHTSQPLHQHHLYESQGHFAALKPYQSTGDMYSQRPYEVDHQRNPSHESHTSTTSQDSLTLAQEYQQTLPDFEHGYSRT